MWNLSSIFGGSSKDNDTYENAKQHEYEQTKREGFSFDGLLASYANEKDDDDKDD